MSGESAMIVKKQQGSVILDFLKVAKKSSLNHGVRLDIKMAGLESSISLLLDVHVLAVSAYNTNSPKTPLSTNTTTAA